MLFRTAILTAVATGLIITLVARFVPGRAAEEKAPAPVPAGAASPAAFLAGASSCAGRACHGGSEPLAKPIQQNEYSTWLVHDKHAAAYQSLLSERGQRIGTNLGTSAHEDARCLACHVNPVLAAANIPTELLSLRGEGVSCEACHGPAKTDHAWLAAHTTDAWKKSPEQRAQHHMTNVTDPAAQAAICAGCHVGAAADEVNGIPVRDCNHDLMAAGHPRLNFELSVFRINEPPHWRTDQGKDDAGHGAKIWAVGQAAAARASLELLAHRAAEAAAAFDHVDEADRPPWPEFAETDCFTCHADLRQKSWRQNKSYYGGRTPGNLPYSRWFSTMLPALGPLDGAVVPEAIAEFGQLEKSMSKPYPSPKLIAAAARKTSGTVAKLVDSLKDAKIDAAKVQAMIAKVQARKAEVKDLRWEESEQLALALAALHQAELALKNQPPDEKMDKLLRELFQELSYPAKYESPHNFRRGDGLGKALHEVLANP